MKPRLALLALLLASCPAPYGVKMTVTVPTDVQAAFSTAQPGLVMTGDQAVGLLCDPTDKPLTFEAWQGGRTQCERPPNLPWTAYAFRLGPTDLQSLTPLQRMFVTCGKSARIANSGAVDAIAELVQKNNLGSTGKVASAVSDDGACDSDGDWSLKATLLRSP